MIIQGVIILFVLFALSRLILRFKDSSISVFELIAWGVFWAIVVVITLVPQITNYLANLVGVGRGVDVVVYISIILLFYGFFRMSVKLENIESDITKLVRKEALKKKTK